MHGGQSWPLGGPMDSPSKPNDFTRDHLKKNRTVPRRSRHVRWGRENWQSSGQKKKKGKQGPLSPVHIEMHRAAERVHHDRGGHEDIGRHEVVPRARPDSDVAIPTRTKDEEEEERRRRTENEEERRTRKNVRKTKKV